jgi:hypothetical protein
MIGLIILSKLIKITLTTLTHFVNLGKIEEDTVRLERVHKCHKMLNVI